MRATILAGLLGALLLGLPPAATGGDDAPPPRVRVIYVPRDELDVLFGGKTRAMLLEYAEYLGLRRLADANPEAPTPPAGYAIGRAEYVLTVADRAATGTGRLDLTVLRDGLRLVRVPVAGLGLTAATLDDAEAAIGRDRGGEFVAVEGRGAHRLDLGLSCRVKPEDGDRFRLAATLPAAARGFLELRIPGRQKVTTAAPHRTVYPATDDVTIVGVHLDASGRIDLRWTPRHDAVTRQALLHADVRQATSVEDEAVRLDAAATFDVHRKPVDRLRVDVPEALTLTDVRADGMLDWSAEVADGRRVVTVRFAAPFTGRRTVRVVGESAFPGPGETDLPLAGAPDAARLDGRVGIAYGPGLRGRVVASSGVVRDDPEAKINLEAFAFHVAERSIRLLVERPQLELSASVRTLLQLGETSRVIDASVAYTPKGRRIYAFSPVVPAGYEVTHVLVDGKSDGFAWEAGADGVVSIHLPRGVDAGATARVRIRAETDDATWRDESVRETTRPLVAVSAGTGIEQDGVLGVAAFSDFDVRDEDVAGFEPVSVERLKAEGIAAVNAVLAYRYRGAPGTGTLVVTRRDPLVVARVTTIAAPAREAVTVRSRVDLTILRAGIRRVTLRVTGGHGDRVHVEGAGIRSKRRTRDAGTGVDLWTIEFQDLRHEAASLDVVLEEKAAEDGAFEVPQVSVVGIADQAGWTAVESSPGLEIGLEADGLVEVESDRVPVPPGHAVAHGFVAAYRWIRPEHRLSLRITRFEELPVLAAVATSVELRTRVSREGLARTRVSLRMRNTDRQFLEVGLPEGSRLWSALVDGAPVKPLVEAGRVLLPLPRSAGEAREFPVVVVYETELPELTGKGVLNLDPPRLGLAGTRFEWTVHLPDGYEAVRTDGAFRDEFTARRAPLLFRLLGGLRLSRSLAGGPDSEAVFGAAQQMPTNGQETTGLAKSPPGYGEGEIPPIEMEEEPIADPAVTEDHNEMDVPPPAKAPAPPAPKPTSPGDGYRGSGGEVPPDMRDPTDPEAPSDESYSSFTVGRDVYAGVMRKGLLSLDVAVTGGGERARISAVGPVAPIQLEYREPAHRAGWGWFLMAATFGLGLIAVRLGLVRPATWCVVLGALATAAPFLFDALETTLWDGVFAGALLTGLVFAGRALVRWIGARAAATAAVLLLALLPGVASAAGDVETLHVPYDPTDPSTLVGIEKVVIPYERFVELWNRAHPDRAIERPEALPVSAVLTGARYEGAIGADDESVRLTARFGIYLPRDGVVEVALPLAPAALEGATLDGEPTAVASVRGGLKAIVETAGFHELALVLRAPVARSGPHGALDVRVPAIARSSLAIAVPGIGLDVTLGSAGALGTREEGKTSVTAVLGAVDAIRLRWGPRGPTRDGSLSVTGTSRALVHVRRGHVDLVSEVVLAVEGGEIAELVCDLGGGLVVRQADAPHLLDWKQEDATLRLRFRPAATGSVTIRVVGGVETGGGGAELEAPFVAPRGLVRESGFLAVHADAGLTLVPGESTGLRRIGFDAGMFKNLGAKSFGPRQLAYRFSRRPATLTLRSAPAAARLLADERVFQHVAADAVETALVADLEVRDAPLHSLEFDLPGTAKVESVDGKQIRDWLTAEADGGRTRLTVALLRGLVGKRRFVVTLRTTREDGPVALPDPRVVGADRTSGLVTVDAPEDLDLTVTEATGLRPVSATGLETRSPGGGEPRFAYRHEGGAWSAVATTRPRVARMRPIVSTHVVVEDDLVSVDTQITYAIQGGGVRLLRVFVPEGEGRDMLWRVAGLRDRTTSAETVDGVPGTVHRLALRADVTGTFRVRMVYDRRIREESMRLRSIRALDGSAGRAFVLLSNRSDLLVRPDDAESGLTAGRPEDMPYLTGDPASYSHAFSAQRGAWSLGLGFRRFAFDRYDAALVTRASLTTVMSPQGWTRNRMIYTLLNRSLQHLQVSLPEKAQLEAVLVDGRPVKPARPRDDSGRILIPLRRAGLGESSTDVVLLYAYDLGIGDEGIAGAGTMDLLAPELHDLPLAETYWELHLPEGFAYDFEGNLDRDESAVEEVQEVYALQRELSFNETIESETGGNEAQQARFAANRLESSVRLDVKAKEAVSKLERLRSRGVSKEVAKQVEQRIDELNDLIDDNLAKNLRDVKDRGQLDQLRAQVQQQKGLIVARTMDVPALAEVPQLGVRFRTAASQGRETRGKVGLIEKGWYSNPQGGGQAGEVARSQTREQTKVGQTMVTGTIAPTDLGVRRDGETAGEGRIVLPGGYEDTDLTIASWNRAVPGTLSAIFTPGAGDGSDGDFEPTFDVTLNTDAKPGGEWNFRKFRVPPGVTVKLVGSKPVTILSLPKLEIEGTIDASGYAHAWKAMREAGVEVTGLGGPNGPLAVLDDVTSGLENDARAGFVNLGRTRAAGRFFNDGRDGDVRGGAGEQTYGLDHDVELRSANNIEIQGGSILAEGGAGGAFRGLRRAITSEATITVRQAGVLSLDVPLPTGGVVFRFRKENGDPELGVSASDGSRGRGWLGFLGLAAAIGAFLGIRALDRRRPFPGFRAVVVFVLALASAIVAGTVVLSVLVMLGASIWFTATWLRARAAE